MIRFYKRIAFLMALWVMVPSLSYAAWDLFGAGAVATSVADVVKAGATAGVQTLLILTIKSVLPQLMGFIVLIVCIIAAIVSLSLGAKILDDFKDVIREEFKKEKSTAFDKIVVLFYGVLTTPTILVLLGFGSFLAYASWSGISGFIK